MAERPRRGSRGGANKDDELPAVRSCGTMEVHERLLRTDPTYLAARNDSENRAFAYGQRPDVLGRTGVTVIPVVVHVVYNGAAAVPVVPKAVSRITTPSVSGGPPGNCA